MKNATKNPNNAIFIAKVLSDLGKIHLTNRFLKSVVYRAENN